MFDGHYGLDMALRQPHTPATLGATGVLLICGGALVLMSRAWGLAGGALTHQFAAVAGPVGATLGLGMAIHGAAMPPVGATIVTRVWGLIGSAFAVLNLWSLGYFEAHGRMGSAVRLIVPVALIAAWLLPGRYYGQEESAAGTGGEH